MFRPAATIVTLLLAVTVSSGCQTARKLELAASGAPAFERFSADYEIPCAAENLVRSFPNARQSVDAATDDASIQPVSEERAASLPNIRAARLKIECPNPDGAPSEARLTVEVQPQASSTGKPAVIESRSLVVPRQQVELLIFDLARAGFFDDPELPEARTALSVSIDGARVTKNWRTDDRLLDFAYRTLHRGATTPQ